MPSILAASRQVFVIVVVTAPAASSVSTLQCETELLQLEGLGDWSISSCTGALGVWGGLHQLEDPTFQYLVFQNEVMYSPVIFLCYGASWMGLCLGIVHYDQKGKYNKLIACLLNSF